MKDELDIYFFAFIDYNKIYKKENDIMNKLKDKLRGYSTLTEEEKKDCIKDEIGVMKEKQQLELINMYNAEMGNEEIYPISNKMLVDIFEDSLSSYLENYDHAEDFDTMHHKYIVYKDGWWNTVEEIDEACDLDAIANYIYDNWEDYEDYFDEDIFNDELYDDEDEEEVAELKAQGLI